DRKQANRDPPQPRGRVAPREIWIILQSAVIRLTRSQPTAVRPSTPAPQCPAWLESRDVVPRPSLSPPLPCGFRRIAPDAAQDAAPPRIRYPIRAPAREWLRHHLLRHRNRPLRLLPSTSRDSAPRSQPEPAFFAVAANPRTLAQS